MPRTPSIGVACALLASLAALSPELAEAKAATVRLKNGGWVEGDVMSVVPEQEVQVRLADGSVRTLPWADVATVEETTAPPPKLASPPAPPRAPSVTPQSGDFERPPEPTRRLPPIPRAWLSVFGFLASGGSVDTTNVNAFTPPQYGKVELNTTFGGGVQLGYAVNRVLGVAFLGQYVSWRAERVEDRSGFFDAAVAPRFRLDLDTSGTPAGVFIQLPVGIGLVSLDDNASDAKWKTTPALFFGCNAGFEAAITPRVLGFASIGWSRHAFTLDVETVQSPAVTSDIEIDQVMFQLGLSYALSNL